jgi:4-aminobutyrate aminotransferase
MSNKKFTSDAIRAMAKADVTPAVYRSTEVAFERGEGVYLYDFEGRKYIDFAAGICTMNAGHNHPEVVAAICDQANKLIHAQPHMGYMEPYVTLIEALKQVVPGDLKTGKAMWVNSGSEAVETGIKLARYVTGRPMILAFMRAFHGRTVGALACTASSAKFRRRMSGLLNGVFHTPYPHCYRCPLGHHDSQKCGLACLEMVELALETMLPADDLAGILVEPIAGEGGYIVPPDGFLQGLRKICDRTGALLIADEVQTGMGRTGKMFAVEHWNVVPDVLVLGKAIGGGLPLGGVIARADLMDQWSPGAHGSTFGGNPVACRAGLATLQVLVRDKVPDNAAKVGTFLKDKFKAAQARLPVVGDVRGRGLMVGVEIVDRDGRPAVDAAKAVLHKVADAGLVMSKCEGSALRIAPPLVITQEQAEQGADIILKALGELSV